MMTREEFLTKRLAERGTELEGVRSVLLELNQALDAYWNGARSEKHIQRVCDAQGNARIVLFGDPQCAHNAFAQTRHGYICTQCGRPE